MKRPAATPVILTVDSPKTGIDLSRVNNRMIAQSPALRSHRPVRGRLPLPADGAAKSRFRIATTGAWTVIVEPQDTAVPFVSTVTGRGPEVLAYQGAPPW
ncbi:hypothetical protein [Actinomadura alba]|uniref:Uncharacterized protein n=1 Tax=Actinomadura alba TaxID=406431 RepID=A0ABR7LTU7_9ACTN|nr:hypothetical protein [Actinomadura alba]MBC6468274.1 hypothetical protein [Actinomadura alba]